MTRPTLQHFVEAQDPVWPSVLAELTAGRKVSHWMWFVFPQIEGLGRSGMARRFAIHSLDEARAYLADPVLGKRLREATDLLLRHRRSSAEAILGPIDAMKLRSSLTLFIKADPAAPIFRDALEAFFDGEPDPLTLEQLGA